MYSPLTQSFRDCYEGQFIKGELKEGKIAYATGENKKGTFRAGELYGHGTHTTNTSECSVFFKGGLKHGKGLEKYFNTCHFSGFYINGQKVWHGSMTFGNKQDLDKSNNIKLESPWLAGRVRCGGMISNTSTKDSLPSFNKASSKYKWLSQLQKNEDRAMQKLRRRHEKNSEIHRLLRIEIQSKKKAIFEKRRRQLKPMLNRLHMEGGKTKSKSNEGNLCENDNSESQLPTEFRYYTFRQMTRAPVSLKESKENPGLRTDITQLSKKRTNLHQQIMKMENEVKNARCTAHKTPLRVAVQDTHKAIEERWSMINIGRIRHNIERRKGRK